MKRSRIVFAATGGLFAVLAPYLAYATGNLWQTFPSGNCATSVAAPYVIACNPNVGERAVAYDNGTNSSASFTAIPEAYAVNITNDFQGNPWVVNSAGSIWSALSGNHADNAFVLFDDSRVWSTVAVGAGGAGDMWAIDSEGNVWQFNGTPTIAKRADGTWNEVTYNSFGTATGIALFYETMSCSNNNSVHVPWIVTSAHDLYAFDPPSPSTDACSVGNFIRQPGGGTSIAPNFVLGNDNNVYHYNGDGTFSEFIPGGGLSSIGSSWPGYSGVWAIASNGSIMFSYWDAGI